MADPYSEESPLRSAPVGGPAGWLKVLAEHGVQRADAIVAAYFADGAALGLNADLAIAQAIHETGWFTSARWLQQWNPAGLGITDSSVPGPTFDTIADGARAHLQHLCCYCYGPTDCPAHRQHLVDPRHVFHDNLPLLKDLIRPPARSWAVPGTGYVAALVQIVNDAVQGDPPPMPEPAAAPEIVDLREQLPHAEGQGDGRTFGPKRGAILHYSAVDYPADRDVVDILTSEANFHIGPYLQEYSLAYHYSVDPYTGKIFQCRDDDAVLWHCGYWGTPGNMDGYAIHVPGGPTVRLSDAARASLVSLLAFLADRDGYPRHLLKGHQEVSPTACPGPLQDAFVLPYRAGKWDVVPPAGPPDPGRIFDETGHAVAGTYKGFWERFGDDKLSLEIFGLPVSDVVHEYPFSCQYFERAVMEDHGGYILLRRIGAAAAAAAGLKGPGL